jgi:hypothetical protein
VVRVFCTKAFRRFQRRESISNSALWKCVDQAQAGLIDADLGGGLIKQRVPRLGQGKRSGYRTILAFRAGVRSVFLYGFAKSARSNIGPDELASWRELGKELLAASSEAIDEAVAADELTEVHRGKTAKDD